jgi:hypothetical protein
MKLIASFSFFCMFISSNLLYSQTIKTDTTAHFRLELGAAIGVGAMALNYINVSEKNSSNGSSSSSSTLGFSTDLLNEFTVYGLAKFNSTFGLGLEFGRLTHFEQIGSLRVSNNSGFPITVPLNEFISGIYVSPFVKFGKISVGATFMSPVAGTYFARVDDYLGSDLNYESLDSTAQQSLQSALQSYINVYGKYDYDATSLAGLPTIVYAKVGVNLQNPIDYSKNYDLKNHYRLFVTAGISMGFDVIK